MRMFYCERVHDDPVQCSYETLCILFMSPAFQFLINNVLNDVLNDVFNNVLNDVLNVLNGGKPRLSALMKHQ